MYSKCDKNLLLGVFQVPPPLFYAPFSKFKIDHFEVPIPPADDLNY